MVRLQRPAGVTAYPLSIEPEGRVHVDLAPVRYGEGFDRNILGREGAINCPGEFDVERSEALGVVQGVVLFGHDPATSIVSVVSLAEKTPRMSSHPSVNRSRSRSLRNMAVSSVYIP